ncbi:MAG TPA: hypothetical protein VIX20_00965 [Ktedonobacteraceae bacterium]
MMVETYSERAHSENAVLDIGEDIGALVIYTGQEMLGNEIEVCPKDNHTLKIHTAVLERKVNGRTLYAALFLELPEGDYITLTTPSSEITIIGGQVVELNWQASNVIIHPKTPSNSHSHQHGNGSSQRLSEVSTMCPRDPVVDILPPRYRNGKVVSAAPMGTAPMRYTEDGQVAWDEMWTDFCDLALAGGPPHRDTLLEPVPPDEVNADLENYERVVSEIERGWRLVTGLATVRSEKLGWVGLQCKDEEMALWILRAIVVENVCVRREGNVLYLPAGPAFRLDKEIKNVITVVAKTHHYWTEHLC